MQDKNILHLAQNLAACINTRMYCTLQICTIDSTLAHYRNLTYKTNNSHGILTFSAYARMCGASIKANPFQVVLYLLPILEDNFVIYCV